MRRYRYGDPKSTKGRNRVIGQVLKFVIGWNIFGYCVWTYFKNSASKLDPEFEKKSSSQKILSMMGYKDMEHSVYRVKFGSDGISLKKKDENSASDGNDKSSEATNLEISKESSSDTTNGCTKDR